jgi:hypothetical protein
MVMNDTAREKHEGMLRRERIGSAVASPPSGCSGGVMKSFSARTLESPIVSSRNAKRRQVVTAKT